MNLNERITKIISYSELSSSEFADEIEVPRSSISHITSGRNKPSLELITKIKTRFPELEWNWLITGEGEMLKIAEIEIKEEIAGKSKTTSLPDLFSLIDDNNFGITESEDAVQNISSRESNISTPNIKNKKIDDSQRLENLKQINSTQSTDNHENKLKRIVLFYENGKFESFEP